MITSALPRPPRALDVNRTHDFHGQPAIDLLTPAGDRATVLLDGAHVVSWIPAGGRERLYLSERSAYGAGAAVRGGVPVIFPQFNQRGPDFSLPKHGFARTRRWKQAQENGSGAQDAASVALQLVDDAETRDLWPHRFHLTLIVSLGSHRLDLALRVDNPGRAPLAFTAALHTYLAVSDIARATVRGLQGVRYLDTVSNVGSVGADPDLTFERETDRIYYEVPGPLTLLSPDDGVLEVAMEGFRDAVVWNPWRDLGAALPDMPADGYRRMLCIEAAAIDKPVRLDAGQSWLGRQTLTVR
jgi:glucose-6-phosphate 1-epimerase